MKKFGKRQIALLSGIVAVVLALGLIISALVEVSELEGESVQSVVTTGNITIISNSDADSAAGSASDGAASDADTGSASDGTASDADTGSASDGTVSDGAASDSAETADTASDGTASADTASSGDTSDGDEDTFEPRTEEELTAEVEELEAEADEAGTEYEGYIVKLADGSDAVTAIAETGVLSELGGNMYQADTLEEIFENVDASEIEYIEPDYIVTLAYVGDFTEYVSGDADDADVSGAAADSGTIADSDDADDTSDADSAESPNDEYYLDGSQWNLEVMNVQSAWEYGLEGTSVSDGEEVVIAIIDSGINSEHEDIDESHILDGYSYVTTDTTDTSDSLGHGTFVSGQIFAIKDNEVGISGMMPDVYIMPLRVFGSSSSAYTSDIVSAIDYAVESGEVDVISMSLGGSSSSTSMENACEEAVEAGIIVVASAGNDGDYTLNYPAAYDCVIGVGSTGTADSYTEVSSFSSRGTTNVFCTAPGYKLTSTYYDSTDSYYTGSGTSFSCPEVAALAALAKSIDRSITQDEFKQLIIDTAIDLGDEGRDSDYGYGLIDFGAAAEYLIDTDVEQSSVTVVIQNENGDTVEDAVLTITKYGETTAIEPGTDGTYTLDVGRYSYTVTADNYQSAEGTFAVITASRTVVITLEGLEYPVTVTAVNTSGELLDAVITIKNSKGATQSAAEDDSTSYELKTGIYTYSISATGYYTQTGSFEVGEGGGSIQVTLYGDIDVASASLNTINADGDKISGVTVTIYNSEGGEIEVYSDGYYKLYPGDYTYTATAANYQDETGEFTITDDQKGTIITIDIPMLNPIVWVYFDVVPIFADVVVYDSDGEVVEAYDAGEYKLLKGTYTYEVSADGYETETGEFTITTTGMTIETELTSSDAAENAAVVFVSNGGSAVSSILAVLGEKIEEPDEPTREGYTFAGWYKESSLTTAWDFDTDVVTADTYLYAKWEAKEYNIIYMFGDEVLEGLEPSTHTYGTAVTDLPEAEIEGYRFMYWCSDEDLTEQVTRISAYKASDAVLYEYAEIDTGVYTVTFDSNGGSEVESTESTEENGYMITKPDDPVYEGYTFAGWYLDEDLTEEFDFDTDTITWHTTLYAAWTENIYTITYYDGDEILTGLSPDSYTYGESVGSLPTIEKSGYVFSGWYSDEELTVRVRSIPVGSIGNMVLYAKWDDPQTSVPEDCDYEPDEDGNYPETDAEGYTLIYTQEQLENITLNDTTVKYRLAQSILLTGEWSPLAGSDDYFMGEFDGAGHSIAGLYINSSSTDQSLFGRTKSATIKNLKLYGSVKGASYTAGLISEGYTTTVKNVIADVTVTSTGTSVGGIVASLSGGTISNCINLGDVTCNGEISTATCIRATGGILGNAGAFSSSAVTISSCYNSGTITSSVCTPTGGIVGYTYNSSAVIENCYNMGDITQTGTDYTTYASVGGIAGFMQGGGTVESCYSAGNLSSTKKTAGLVIYRTTPTMSSCYYLEGTADYGRYYLSSSSTTPSSVDDTSGASESFAYSSEMDYSDLISGLGSAYIADEDGSLNGGHPVLAIHSAETAELSIYIIDLQTEETVDDAEIIINGETVESSTVEVSIGLTSFEVSAEGYISESGMFYMGPEDLSLTVALEPESYTYEIIVSPEDAEFTLTNSSLGTLEPDSTETADGAVTYTFTLGTSVIYGEYIYSAEKYGYVTVSGSFEAAADGALSVALEEDEDYQILVFDIYPSNAEVTLTLDGEVIEPYSGTTYHLTDGTYSYTIECDGYYKYTGTVTVPGTTTYISVVLTQYAGWDGSTDTEWYDEDEDTYYIYTAEEFAGFAELCTDGTTFSGKTIILMADIELNDLDWTPIGTYSSSSTPTTGFQGTLDGNGYTISGLNAVSASTDRMGLFRFMYDATIKNLTVEGTVSGRCYIGGIAATANACTFENVTSDIEVTAARYQAGGIVGQATHGGTYTRCRNLGSITSTSTSYTSTNSYALGGIIGAATSGSAEIEYCINNGDISGYIRSVGGIVGYMGATSGSVAPEVLYCYNTGTITNEYASGYAGGIVGRAYGSYNTGSVTGSVNLGSIECESSSGTGGIAGYISGTSVEFADNYYYYTTASYGIGATEDAEGEAESFGSEDDNEYSLIAETLSEAYKLNSDGELILRWEDTDSEYTVTFTAVYDTEDNRSSGSTPAYTVTDGSEIYVVSSAGTVSLQNGTYTYTAGEQGYEDTSGTFVVASTDMEVSVSLAAVLYDLTITYAPEDAELVLTDSLGTEQTPVSEDSGEAVYSLTNGTYTYSLSCYGYEDAEGEIIVSYGAAIAEVSLEKSSEADVTFEISASSGSFTDDPVIGIYQNGSKAAEITGTQQTIVLPVGTYTYIARADGFITTSGEFTVSEACSVSIVLDPKSEDSIVPDTYWYYEDTSADSYEISTLEELCGLAELVNDGIEEFDGKTITLTSDIDMSGSEWEPIGSYETSHFKGTFNGGSHVITISNGTMSGTEISFGLFGYLENASVSDLILRGSVSILHSSDSTSAVVVYVGSLAGYASGSTIERVSSQLNVTVEAEVGSSGVLDVGGLVGWVYNSTINSCNNTGMVTAEITTLGISTNNTTISYAGGIAGYAVAMSSSPLAITNCYNTGAVSTAAGGTACAAGIIGVINSSGSSVTIENCYNTGSITANEGSGSSAAISTSSANGTIRNNYYLEGTAESEFGTSVTSDELKSETIAEALGDEYVYVSGMYPQLCWEQTMSGAEVYTMPDKTEYDDMEDFDDTGLTLLVTYDDGSTEVVTSGWSVLDGEDLRVNKDGETDSSSAEVTVTVEYRGIQVAVPVTVTQVVHTIDESELVLDIEAPVAGETAETITIEEEKYTVTVTWTKEGVDFTGTFEENAFYRAEITLNARYVTGEVWYDFAVNATPSVDSALEVLYKSLSKVSANDGNRTKMTATLTFKATGELADELDSYAFHMYYQGDDNIAVDYTNLLASTLTITLDSESVTYTLEELEQMALEGLGIQNTYTVYNGTTRTNAVYTGLSLYDLCMSTGMFKNSLSDSTVVTIGNAEYTWGQIRATGCSYDAEGTLTGSSLPAIIAFGRDGAPLSASNGPLVVVIPMSSADDVNSGYVNSSVSDIVVSDPEYEDTYSVIFDVSAEDGADISDLVQITLTDIYGNEIAAQDGIYELNAGENYEYKIAADGYGTQYGETGEITGAMVISITLVEVWDGVTLTEPEYSDGYYLISTAAELMWFNQNTDGSANARLMADITLNSDGEYTNVWTPMNTSETNTGAFTGIFDGNGHTIYNLYICYENLYTLEEAYDGSALLYSSRTDVLGMFGYLSGTVMDLGVTGKIEVIDRPDSQYATWMQLGVIAGYVYNGGSIEGCYTDVDIEYSVGTETTVTAGYPDAGFPEYCDTYVGGIAGSVTKGTISNCYSTGSISAVGTRTVNVGGIAGGMRASTAVIEYCYSTSDIYTKPSETASGSFTSGVGSIVGAAVSTVSSSCGSISYCFGLSSSLTAEEGALETYVNRIIGDDSSGTVTLSYNYGSSEMTISGSGTHDEENFSRSSVNGANITLARAKESLTPYTNIGWSALVWKSDSSSVLPSFVWQSTAAEVVTYTVTVDANESVEINFTGGTLQTSSGYVTTSASTITFTIESEYTVSSVTAEGGTLTSAGGYYTISDITGAVTITVTVDYDVTLGDIDMNGVINTRDAIILQRYLAGTYDLTAAQLEAADVNRDGTADQTDVLLILDYTAGNTEGF